jgi:hypothetical protein
MARIHACARALSGRTARFHRRRHARSFEIIQRLLLRVLGYQRTLDGRAVLIVKLEAAAFSVSLLGSIV